MIDITRMLAKLVPEEDGEDVLRKRTATVIEINADSTVDVSMDGVTVESVPALADAVVEPGGTVEMLSYRGGLLILGMAGRIPPAATAVAAGTGSGSATPGTTFTNTLSTGVHGVAFVAPPSGKVWIMGRSVARNDTANGFVLMDLEVRAGAVVGSGTVFRASDNNQASVFESSTAGQEAPLVTDTLITGLTAGSSYNAALTYAAGTAGHTVNYNRRHITVIPQ